MITNPLTWTSSEEPAPIELNQGVLLEDMRKLYPSGADAQIEGRILWVNHLNFPGALFVKNMSKNYHVGDINLFWMNIRANLRTKSRAFSQLSIQKN
jgi:hypothetical protein